MPTHPRRSLAIAPLVDVLRGLVGLGIVRHVVEAPVAAVDAKGAALAYPAVAVNPKSETVGEIGFDSETRELVVEVIVACRTIEECDQVANDVEDRIGELGGWRLQRVAFGYDATVERPFFYAAHTYARQYATTSANRGAQP